MSAFIRFAVTDRSQQYDFSKIESVKFTDDGVNVYFISGREIELGGLNAHDFRLRWNEYASDCQQRERMAAFDR